MKPLKEKIKKRNVKKSYGLSLPIFLILLKCRKGHSGNTGKKISPEEKAEFIGLFTSILKNTYLGETGTYSAKKIVLVGEKERGKYATIQTNFILNTGKEAAVDFRMMSNDGKWKIYDVIIEGVSLVNNYRSQFSSILVKSPYAELIKRLKKKITEE